jgi:hypothetical protein
MAAISLTFTGVGALLLACFRFCRVAADLFRMSESLSFVATPSFALISFNCS